MCLAQGPQPSDAGEAQTRGHSVSSQALYHWATALPILEHLPYSYLTHALPGLIQASMSKIQGLFKDFLKPLQQFSRT